MPDAPPFIGDPSTMTTIIADLIASLTPDSRRAELGFSDETREATDKLLDPSCTVDQAKTVLNSWLERYQPCLFGRVAAKLQDVHFCILTPVDLQGSDESIQAKIQDSRRLWTREAFHGNGSAFLIAALSRDIAEALPGECSQRLAERLCSLYLLKPVYADLIYNDEIFLEVPTNQRATWRWLCGVNYFCAQGDRR
jgi:hypothetical protein